VVLGPVIVEDLNETLESVSSFSETSGSPKSNTTVEATPISLETCSITYFASYLAKKCIKKFNCEMCNVNLITTININDENHLLLKNKTYDYTLQEYGLKALTNILLEITTICLNVFKNNFDEMKCNKKLPNAGAPIGAAYKIWMCTSLVSSFLLDVVDPPTFGSILDNASAVFAAFAPTIFRALQIFVR